MYIILVFYPHNYNITERYYLTYRTIVLYTTYDYIIVCTLVSSSRYITVVSITYTPLYQCVHTTMVLHAHHCTNVCTQLWY